MQINIPANTSALIHIPNLGQPWPLIEESGRILVKAGQDIKLPEDVKLIDITQEGAIFEVGSGKYSFTAKL